MNESDYILIVTAIILAYYSYETYKIRRETSKQNTLLAEQLLLMQESHQYNLQKEKSFIEPILKFTGSKYSDIEASISVINKGGPARKISFVPSGDFSIQLRPDNDLDTNDQVRIILKSNSFSKSNRWFFEMYFEDTMGSKQSQRFYYFPAEGKIYPKESVT